MYAKNVHNMQSNMENNMEDRRARTAIDIFFIFMLYTLRQRFSTSGTREIILVTTENTRRKGVEMK